MIIAGLVIIITLAALYLIDEVAAPPKKEHCEDCVSCKKPCERHNNK